MLITNPIGPAIQIGTGATASGVDVTTDFVGSSRTLNNFDWVLLGTVSMTGRGAGGNPPVIDFNYLGGIGGANTASVEVLMVRDFGTVGLWDSADQICNLGYDDFVQFSHDITGGFVTARRDYLIMVRRSPLSPDTGSLRITCGGFGGGTNVIWTESDLHEPITLTLTTSTGSGPAPVPAPDSGGEDDSGCSTSEHGHGFLFLASLGALLAVFRLQRRKA